MLKEQSGKEKVLESYRDGSESEEVCKSATMYVVDVRPQSRYFYSFIFCRGSVGSFGQYIIKKCFHSVPPVPSYLRFSLSLSSFLLSFLLFSLDSAFFLLLPLQSAKPSQETKPGLFQLYVAYIIENPALRLIGATNFYQFLLLAKRLVSLSLMVFVLSIFAVSVRFSWF